MNPGRTPKRIDGRGRCDLCGMPPHHHRKASGTAYMAGHTYECAVDDRIRETRKARFVGSVGWSAGYTRRYIPETRMYQVTWNETPMDQCGWPGCSRGTHAGLSWSTTQAGQHTYRRPTDAQLLERMRARRAARIRRRVDDRCAWTTFGDVWHAWVEGDEADAFAVNRLYATRRAAEVTTRLRLGVSRFVPLVRDEDRPYRWTLWSGKQEVTAVIMRRHVWQGVAQS